LTKTGSEIKMSNALSKRYNLLYTQNNKYQTKLLDKAKQMSSQFQTELLDKVMTV